jgi:hypothetical protein
MRLILSSKIKVKSVLFLIIFLFVFTECSDKRKYNYINYKKLGRPSHTIKLRSSKFNNNNFDVYQPSNLEIVDNYLIMLDTKADKMIKIIDLNSNELLKSFGRKGQGPDEFISVGQIILSQKDINTFWIYDIFMRSLKKFDLKAILNDNFDPEKIISISSEKSGVPTQLTITHENNIFGVGFFFKHRISIYDMSGNYIKGMGRVPFILKDEGFASHHSHGFIGNFIFKEKFREIYIATRYGSIIEKYDIDGNLISTLYGPELFFPQYSIVPSGQSYSMTYNKKTRFGYIDIQYNEKMNKLFLLYSGRYKHENINANFGNTIYVLNNKDNVEEKLELDKEIFRMRIPDDCSVIYGLTGTEILIFPIGKK